MKTLSTPEADTADSLPAKVARNPSMTALDQAAILLLSLGDQNSAGVLRHFSREEIVAVSQAMARIGNLKQPMVCEVIGRFFDDYKEQSNLKGASRGYLAGMLGKALGSDIARSLLDGIYGEEIRTKMRRLEWVDPRQFGALIAKEHAQMQAVFLAFLPPGLATEVLEGMPAWRQDELLYRVANLNEINGDVIRELETLIERSLSVLSSQSSRVRGVKQAADIMNRFKGDRGRMFESLRAQEEGLVEKIEDEMYDFFILSRQTPEVLQALLEQIPLDDWVVALKGAEPSMVKAVRDALPRRQIQQLENLTRRLGPVPLSQVEQVRKEIMNNVREMAADGGLQIQLFREPTVE